MSTVEPESVPAGTADEDEAVIRCYLQSFNLRDPDALLGYWADGAIDRLVGDRELVAPDQLRHYYAEMFAAFPDFCLTVHDITPVDGRCAVRWTATGTFTGPARFEGLAPNDANITLEGADFFHISDGTIRHNDAFVDRMSVARQIGVLPADGSMGDRVTRALFNVKTALRRRGRR